MSWFVGFSIKELLPDGMLDIYASSPSVLHPRPLPTPAGEMHHWFRAFEHVMICTDVCSGLLLKSPLTTKLSACPDVMTVDIKMIADINFFIMLLLIIFCREYRIGWFLQKKIGFFRRQGCVHLGFFVRFKKEGRLI
jgi:hypothetical protein